MDLNLSSLTMILLSENHLMVFLDSVISISNNSLTDLANDDRILSSAKIVGRCFSNANEKIQIHIKENWPNHRALRNPPSPESASLTQLKCIHKNGT